MNSPSTTAKKDKAESLHPRNPEPEPENETIIENTVKLKFKKRLTFQNQLFESRNDRVNVPVPDPGQPQHCGARVRESGTGTREISMILIFAFLIFSLLHFLKNIELNMGGSASSVSTEARTLMNAQVPRIISDWSTLLVKV